MNWDAARNLPTAVTAQAASGSTTGGALTSAAYGASNGITTYRPTTGTDAQGQSQGYTFDTATGQILKVTTPGGLGGAPEWSYQNDMNNTTCGGRTGQLCTSTNGNGKVATYTYDTAGNLTRVTPPAPLGASSYTYDAAGRVATVTDGKGQTATYTYDGDDRTTQVNYGTGSTCAAATCVKTIYDADGNTPQTVDASGTTTFGYDAQNRLTGKTAIYNFRRDDDQRGLRRRGERRLLHRPRRHHRVRLRPGQPPHVLG